MSDKFEFDSRFPEDKKPLWKKIIKWGVVSIIIIIFILVGLYVYSYMSALTMWH